MEENTPQDNQLTVAHDMVLVQLAASRFFPAHINPDFLRFNEVVDPGWQMELPVIVESGFSQVDYTNGLSITAGEDYFRVEQSGQPLNMEELLVPEVLSRCLVATPWLVNYEFIVVDWRGTIGVSNQSDGLKSAPLHDLRRRANYSGIEPETQVRVTYRFPDKILTMFFSETMEDNAITEVQCRAYVRRNMDNLPENEQDGFIYSVLEGLSEDINGFVELVAHFYSG